MMASLSIRPNSLLDDIRALWMVRSRVLRGNLAFFLVIIGYDTRSKSINNRIYLIYALIFFALWIFMVLTLLADYGAKVLAALPFDSAESAATLFGALALLGLGLVELYGATRRSPLSFSDMDAQLIALSPLDRRVVTVEWFLEHWLLHGLAVWAGAVVLGYALLQAQFPRQMTPADLPVYLVAGFRMFLIAVPLYMGLLGLAWTPGIFRLRGQVESVNLRWLPIILGVLLVLGFYLSGWERAIIWLIPLTFPVQAGLALAPFGAGLLAALLLGVVALAALWMVSRDISLARAAQESRDREAVQAAMRTGRSDLAGDLANQRRLGAGRRPTRMPGWSGWRSLLWKNVLQSRRRVDVGEVLAWLSIFGLNLIFLTAPNLMTQAWSVVAWVLFLLQRAIVPLRRDLSRWWLLRQLPFSSENLVASSAALPVLGAWLAGIVALVVVLVAGYSVSPIALVIVLSSVPGVALAGAADVLRQSHTGRLLVGGVPDITLLGVILGLLVVLINYGAAWLAMTVLGLPALLSLPVIVVAGIVVTNIFWKWAGSLLRKVE